MFEVPNPQVPRHAKPNGRAKTRHTVFGARSAAATETSAAEGPKPAAEKDRMAFPVGWLVIVRGPGRGTGFALQHLVATIGRGQDQTIALNFGDGKISQRGHAAVAYDETLNACFLGLGAKANLVRLNGRPVLDTEALTHGDVISVGATDLRFVALCGPDFTWAPDDSAKAQSADDQ